MSEIKEHDILKEIAATSDQQVLEAIRLRYLGRKGVITQELRGLSDLPAGKRAQAGAKLNKTKQSLERAIKEQKQSLLKQDTLSQAETPIDLTAPALGHKLGHTHPAAEVESQLAHAFSQIGFELAEGPEVETDWYNFEALNIPTGHPARDMFDTFYMEDRRVLRTHTSLVQIRYMEKHRPPVRIISMGRAYRNEDEDATHLAVFRQIEGLVVDKGVSLADLKGTLLYMFRSILGEKADIKLLPSYFPFVEPALEVHVSCVVCSGKNINCRVCKGVGWIEMLGAGMVHPAVLKNVDIDPKVYSGFAFGGGIERITAIKHQIPDIRYFYRPDLRFITQFR